MLGRLTVPILPYLRSTSSSPRLRDGVQVRDTIAIERRPGAVVTVYNAQGDGSAAVSPDGIVAASASLAYVYLDRAGASIMPNPVTLDEIGGPLDLFCAGPGVTSFTFYGFPGVYHLLVVMPNGERFGIQHVRVPFNTHNWIEVRPNDMYSTAVGNTNTPNTNASISTGLALDTSVCRVFAISSGTPAINSAIWAGEEPWLNATAGDEPFLNTGLETGALKGRWARLCMLESSQYCDNSVDRSPTQLTGIAFGHSLVAPIAASPNQAIAALYAKWDSTLAYELLLAKGDNSTAAVKLTLTGVNAPNDPTIDGERGMDRLRILYNPNGKVLEGWVNGWFGGRITTAAAFPSPTDAETAEFNVFSQYGSAATGGFSCAWWHSRYWVGMP
jgi:hypothetical protein